MSEIINIDKKTIQTAASISVDIEDTGVRKRVYALGAAALAAAKYLSSIGIDVKTKYSLFRIPSLAKNLEIADIYAGDARIDVRISFDGKKFSVPKVQNKYGAMPDAYFVLKVDSHLEYAEALGFVNPETLILPESDNEYYNFPTSLLQPSTGLRTYIASLKLKKQPCSSTENEKIRELATSFIDEEISESEKVYFIKHIVACSKCRELFSELVEFDTIVSQVGKHTDLMDDSTLSVLSGNPHEYILSVDADDDSVEEKEETVEEISETEDSGSGVDIPAVVPPVLPLGAVAPVVPVPVPGIVSADVNLDFTESNDVETLEEDNTEIIEEPLSEVEEIVPVEQEPESLNEQLEETLEEAEEAPLDVLEEDVSETELQDTPEIEEEPLDLLEEAPEAEVALEETSLEESDVEALDLLEETDEEQVAETESEENLETLAEETVEPLEELVTDDEIQDVQDEVKLENLETLEEEPEEPEELETLESAEDDSLDSLTELEEVDETSADTLDELVADEDENEGSILSENQDSELSVDEPVLLQEDNALDELLTAEEESLVEDAAPQNDELLELDELTEAQDNSDEILSESETLETAELLTHEETSLDTFAESEESSGLEIEDLDTLDSLQELSEETVSEAEETPISVLEPVEDEVISFNDEKPFAQEELSEEPGEAQEDAVQEDLEKPKFDLLLEAETPSADSMFTPYAQEPVELNYDDEEEEAEPDTAVPAFTAQDAFGQFEQNDEAVSEDDSQNQDSIDALLDDELMSILSDGQQTEEQASYSQENQEISDVQDENEAPETNEEIETLFEEENAENPENQIDVDKEPISEAASGAAKKVLIGAALLFLLAGGAGVAWFMNNNKASDANTDMLDTANKSDSLFDFANKGSADSEEEPAISQDINKSMANSFSDKPAAITVTKISWQVSSELASNESVKEYLQTAGKNIQMNLQNDLANSADVTFNQGIKISFEIAPDNTLKGMQVLESSGSDKIDEAVMKSIKNTLKYVSVPKLKDFKSDYFLTIVINF